MTMACFSAHLCPPIVFTYLPFCSLQSVDSLLQTQHLLRSFDIFGLKWTNPCSMWLLVTSLFQICVAKVIHKNLEWMRNVVVQPRLFFVCKTRFIPRLSFHKALILDLTVVPQAVLRAPSAGFNEREEQKSLELEEEKSLSLSQKYNAKSL